MKNNKRTNNEQKLDLKKNHLQGDRNCIKSISLKSNNTTAGKNCDVSQSVKNKFNVAGNIIKHLNGYVIGGKTENCNVYQRPFHSAKVRCGRNEKNVIILSSTLVIMIHPIRLRCRRYCKICC